MEVRSEMRPTAADGRTIGRDRRFDLLKGNKLARGDSWSISYPGTLHTVTVYRDAVYQCLAAEKRRGKEEELGRVASRMRMNVFVLLSRHGLLTRPKEEGVIQRAHQ